MRLGDHPPTVALFSLLLAYSVLGVPMAGQKESANSADCQVQQEAIPKYRVARQYTTSAKPGLILFVSIAPSDVTEGKLVALGCKLGRDHANEENIFVHVLDTNRAARKFNPLGEGNDRETNLAYRGFYSFSREPGDAYGQSLTWKPDRNDPDRWVHIDLGPPPKRSGG